jgi:hypothetical protein
MVRDIFTQGNTILSWIDIIAAITVAAFGVRAVARMERIGVSNVAEANVSPQWPALHGELARFDGILKEHSERVSDEGQGGDEAEKN